MTDTTMPTPEPDEPEQTTLAPEPEPAPAEDAPAESPASAPTEPSGLSQEAEDTIRANVVSGAIQAHNEAEMTMAIADAHQTSMDAVRAFIHRVWDELRGGTA